VLPIAAVSLLFRVAAMVFLTMALVIRDAGGVLVNLLLPKGCIMKVPLWMEQVVISNVAIPFVV
jgi:hypothetical protein